MPSVYVFTGPTLSAVEVRAHLGTGALVLPPAAQGDVYRAARVHPAAIGIIDGYFDTLPAIWHKEILWAIREGIPVFGSASLGALRAAELAAFGMRGVGEVFEAFRSGVLEDDDEVTLAHEPEANGFRPLSVPMVDLRATLASARAAGILGQRAHDVLVERMKRVFYPERSYPRLFAEGDAAGLRDEMRVLEAWLPGGRVDAKKRDAVAMVRAIAEHVGAGAKEATEPARFSFEHTTYWDALRRGCDATPAGVFREPVEGRGVLDEARLRGGFAALRTRAVNRVLARAHASREGRGVEPERLARAANDFRAARGLLDAAAFQTWLASRDLDEATFARLLEADAGERWMLSDAEVEGLALDELKLEDEYPELRERAREKAVALASSGQAEPGLAATGMSKEQIVAWYFREITRAAVPGEMGPFLEREGFAGEEHFLKTIVREHVFRRRTPTG